MDLSKATVILRGFDLRQVDAVAQVLKSNAAKIKSLEITLNTENALDIIETISSRYCDDLLVGAGTVLNLEDVRASQSAGAKFVLSPIMLESSAIEFCKKHDVLCIPSAMTPSEAYKMHSLGADILKIFPARLVGYEFFSELKAPLGDLKLMAVGGVSAENARLYLENGADYVGSASGIFKSADIRNLDFERMRASLAHFERML